MELIKTTSYSQEEILLGIQKLYTGEFEYDATYGMGNFYKGNVKEPLIKSDISPKFSDVKKIDSTSIPFKTSSILSIIFDPPFVVGPSKFPGIIRDKYGCYKDVKSLWGMYYKSMEEFYRILNNGGFLIFKCQDIVSSGKNWFTHVEIMNYAYKIGFYPRDLFVLLAKHRLNSPSMKNQKHARKYHSFFWVLEKSKQKVNYSII